MALSVPLGFVETLSYALLVATFVISVYLLRGPTAGVGLGETLRRRFVLGVPWGTLAVGVGLLAVYYLLQGGGRPGGPVVVPFRSWGFGNPVGLLIAAFAHASDSHLTGNLLGTLVFASIAEYVWSHYPTERGSHSFGGRWSNPFVRIGLFVGGVVLVGLATSLFTAGALIGFSGVVFAFAGFALVVRPWLAVGGLVAERVVRLTYNAVQDPVSVARASEQFVSPFYAGIAIQGHALGLFIGVLLGFWVVRTREEWPDYRGVWFATLVFAADKALYAIYWFRGSSEYVLFRGLGLAAILVLAGLTALAMARSNRLLVARIGLSRREATVGLFIALVAASAVVAVPFNLVDPAPGPAADSGVEVQDYTITYAENVPNEYSAGFPIPLFRPYLTYNTSGVIVTSDRRDAWEQVVPAGRLASQGRATVALGGVGWRETVVVTRSGWSAVEGKTTYKVFVEPEGQQREQVYTAEPVIVQAVINDSAIRIRPTADGYALDVVRNESQNETVRRSGPLPESGETTTVAGITFRRTEGKLVASVDGTRVPIATRQT